MGLKYLFEEVQVSRLCLLPKALAISLLFDCETCVVVDSGATSTSVWVVMDNKVDTTRTRTVPVGGWHVSQFLKQALTWKGGSSKPVNAARDTARAVAQRPWTRCLLWGG